MNRNGCIFTLIGFLLVFSCTAPEVLPDGCTLPKPKHTPPQWVN